MPRVSVIGQTGEIKVSSSGKKVASSEFGRIAAQTAKQIMAWVGQNAPQTAPAP